MRKTLQYVNLRILIFLQSGERQNKSRGNEHKKDSEKNPFVMRHESDR